MKKIMKLMIIACLTMAFVLAPVEHSMAVEEEKGITVCNHPDSATRSEEVSSWNWSHVIVYSYDPYQSATCYAREWVTRVTSYCTTCGYVFGYVDRHHEHHTLCGVSY